MSWNFRLVKEEELVRLREVYYDDEGYPELLGTNEVILGQFGEELLWYREKLIEALQKPVIDFPFTGPMQMELDLK
tara:strand:+ start:225 stop:452 length:228 start_codon:yes stop_codon:yes gene_type:complete